MSAAIIEAAFNNKPDFMDTSHNRAAADLKTELQEKALLRKADQLSNFGTLTSLVSTAAYFAEQTFLKAKLSANVAKATLAAVGVGIATTLASYYYRYKAGKVALINDKSCGPGKAGGTGCTFCTGNS